ncbi:MAG TPA: hypothetical protein VHQ90_05320 [Thermoanaerobaculia bacterium]|nr:hypothetical protein [Thermoanaerobaculia bacterium]
MRKSLQLIVPFALLTSLPLQGQKPDLPRLEGHWEGVAVSVPGEMEADVEIDIARTGEKLQGRFDFTTQGKTYEIQDLLLRDHAVSFAVVDEQKVTDFFNGTISPDSSEITGKMTENLQSFPFTLHRREPTPDRADFLPPVLRVADDGAELRQAFNGDQGHVRLLMTLSPTSPYSKMLLRIVQRYVLDPIASSDLRVYVVWEPVARADSEQISYAASHLVSDPRLRQFWSASRFTGHAFAHLAGHDGKPLANSFLVFDRDKKWTDQPPTPDHTRLPLQNGVNPPADQRLNGAKLADDLNARLLPKPGR